MIMLPSSPYSCQSDVFGVLCHACVHDGARTLVARTVIREVLFAVCDLHRVCIAIYDHGWLEASAYMWY